MKQALTRRFFLQRTALLAVLLLFTLNACVGNPSVPPIVPPNKESTATKAATATEVAAAPTRKASSTPHPTMVFPTRTPTITRTPWPADAAKLRDLAQARNFFIGAAVQSSLLANEEQYRQTVMQEFNVVTSEYESKMCEVWPERDRWNFAPTDAIVQFAQENNMHVRGHTLIWIECVPEWVEQGTFSKEEATEILHEYITTVVTRYKGKIAYWDVVNESVERAPIWEKLIGPEYFQLAFQWAREADPDAKLFYNDYGAETMGGKGDRVYEMLKKHLEEGVPIDGVGLQMHLKSRIDTSSLATNIDRLNALGLEVHITELDMPLMPGNANPAQLQAEIYYGVMKVCLQAKNCPVFIIWGVTDKYTWLNNDPRNPKADTQPLLFDKEYRPKPAYEALFKALQER